MKNKKKWVIKKEDSNVPSKGQPEKQEMQIWVLAPRPWRINLCLQNKANQEIDQKILTLAAERRGNYCKKKPKQRPTKQILIIMSTS